MTHSAMHRAKDELVTSRELAERVELIWRMSRPNLMSLYDRTEQTKERTMEAARFWQETTQDLQQKGMPFDQANNFAMYEWVYLPDIDDEDEAVILSEAQRPPTEDE